MTAEERKVVGKLFIELENHHEKVLAVKNQLSENLQTRIASHENYLTLINEIEEAMKAINRFETLLTQIDNESETIAEKEARLQRLKAEADAKRKAYEDAKPPYTLEEYEKRIKETEWTIAHIDDMALERSKNPPYKTEEERREAEEQFERVLNQRTK